MLRQPADAPPPLAPLSTTEPVITFHQVSMARNTAARRSLRSWAGRVSGRADRRLLLALVGATEAVIDHCDLLVGRLNAQEAVTGDLSAASGEEIAQLRAEVLHLQRQVALLREATS
jgi:hypothetical protein